LGYNGRGGNPALFDQVAVEELSASFHVDREKNPRDNSYLRISGVSDCRRKLGYRTNWSKEGRQEMPIWSHGLSIFDTGHGIHLKLQERLGNTGCLKWVDGEPCIDNGTFGFQGHFEMRLVNHTERLRGTCDALSHPLKKKWIEVDGNRFQVMERCDEDDPEGRRYIIDIKSITARQRVNIRRCSQTGNLYDAEVKPSPFEKLVKPKPEHISQTSLYSWLTTQPEFQSDRLPGPLSRMPDVMIIYVAKDLDPEYYAQHPEEFTEPRGLLNLPYKVFTAEVNPKQVQMLLSKVRQVWSYLDKGELPPRDYNYTPERVQWACVDCSFRQECYSEEGYFNKEEAAYPDRVLYHLEKLKADDICLT
jgi:hypothetical protein